MNRAGSIGTGLPSNGGASMRRTIFAALLCGAAVLLSACGEESGNQVKETAKAIDKTADHATGRAQLQQKKKLEQKLNGIQQNQQKQLDNALKD